MYPKDYNHEKHEHKHEHDVREPVKPVSKEMFFTYEDEIKNELYIRNHLLVERPLVDRR